MNEMYCDLQSRGIKRKFVEDDDSGDQSQQLPSSDAISANNSTPIVSTKVQNSNTTKNSIQTTINSRILQHSLTVQHCYVRQRQQIFNISICKLNRFRQSSDPSLLRSVLVCNGLKTLERELFREGIKINFGPNGVLFTPPVLNTQNMTLDPPPNALNALVNQNNSNNNCNNTSNNNNNSTNSVIRFETKTSPDVSNYMEIGSETENITDNSNGEYDKYLLDLDSSSGRVTPFQKTQTTSVFDTESSIDFGSTSLSQSANSAFWGSDEASDRLTSLNWSSVFNSSSVVTPSSGVSKTTQLNGQESHPLNGSEESVSNKSSNSSSFTTLLPPSAPTTSSSVTSSITTSRASSLSLSSTSVSSAPLSQNCISSQNVTNSSHSVNHLTVINSNQISYSNNSTNDEIFGDIDLSLYDFDLLSPLSPPNVKLAPITAEELIRTISSTDSNSSTVSSSSSTTNTTSAMSSPLSSSMSSSSPLSTNGSSVYSSSSSSGFHGRYFKSSDKLFSDDRDQQAITPVMS